MTCIKAQSLITPFINNKLNNDELEEFLEHVRTCKNCREELEVYYALLTAVKQLDEDKNLTSNFVQELNDKLEKAEERVIHAKYTYYRKITMLMLTMILLAFFISFSYANRSAEHAATVKESEFRIRVEFREPGSPFLELQLKQYLLEQELDTEINHELEQVPTN
ncbi:MAG TPA: zf-HC2 domain-containing protein [Mobilitalea sp.]|nr:zf-HC2 domain-containing protein [Mobilitalea sp.]